MSASGEKKAPEKSVLMFSYREHDWEVGGEEDARKEMLRRAESEPWTMVQDLTPAQVDGHCDPEIATLDDLSKLVGATLIDDWSMPAGVIQIPLQRLSEWMAREGWRFVSGGWSEFEGNHNDSEIYAVLEKKP